MEIIPWRANGRRPAKPTYLTFQLAAPGPSSERFLRAGLHQKPALWTEIGVLLLPLDAFF